MEELAKALEAWGLSLQRQQVAAFETYYREIIAWNQRFNLTRITSREDVARFHFMDSLSLYLHDAQLGLSKASSVVDVGSGAGFPGIPLKIVCPNLFVTLVESSSKKASFLRHIVGILALKGTEVVQARAEEVARRPEYRERYDVAAARALAPMAVAAELLLPLVRVGGIAVVFKTEDALAELRDAARAIKECGGGEVVVYPYLLPGAEKKRVLVCVPKIRPTPDKYPRRPGQPFKRPLR